MKRYLAAHVPMALLYALAVFAVRSAWWQWDIPRLLTWGWWLLGVVVGVLILFFDRIAYVYSYPTEQLSQQFLWYIGQHKYATALALLDARRLEQGRLAFRSALFMVVWVPLAFFTLTSTVGLFGKGVVMGIMFHILSDAWRMQRTDPQRLHIRLFSLIKRVISDGERLAFLWVMTTIFILFSFWVG